MNFSLIVPAAADKPEYAGRLPKVFTLGSDGVMLCIKSILGLDLSVFDRICFTVLRKHCEAYDVDKLLEMQLCRLGIGKAEILILDTPTETQADTIAATIKEKDIKGGIFIKDADCYFKAEVFRENSVAVYPLEKLELVDPRNKSYVAVDDMQHITNIIEKRIIGNLFNAGGYCFENVDDFLKAYEEYRGLGQIYLSHLVYGLLLSQETFRPIIVKGYKDWNLNER